MSDTSNTTHCLGHQTLMPVTWSNINSPEMWIGRSLPTILSPTIRRMVSAAQHKILPCRIPRLPAGHPSSSDFRFLPLVNGLGRVNFFLECSFIPVADKLRKLSGQAAGGQAVAVLPVQPLVTTAIHTHGCSTGIIRRNANGTHFLVHNIPTSLGWDTPSWVTATITETYPTLEQCQPPSWLTNDHNGKENPTLQWPLPSCFPSPSNYKDSSTELPSPRTVSSHYTAPILASFNLHH